MKCQSPLRPVEKTHEGSETKYLRHPLYKGHTLEPLGAPDFLKPKALFGRGRATYGP